MHNDYADIVDTISSSYDKADDVKFRSQTMTAYFGDRKNYLVFKVGIVKSWQGIVEG